MSDLQGWGGRVGGQCLCVRAGLALLMALMIGLVVGPARAQSMSGAFQLWQSKPTGGVLTNPSGGSFVITVDDDGNVLTPGVDYNLTQQAPALASKSEYSLSPQRDILFVLEDNTQSTNPSRLWFASLDGAGGVSIVHGPFSIPVGQSRLDFGGPRYFDVPGEPLRFAVMILGHPSGVPDLYAQIFDLNNPGLAGQARVNLADGWNASTADFAPSGTHFVIKNGLQDIDPDIFYTIVELCPDRFGQSGIIRDTPGGSDLVFSVENVGGGMLDVVAEDPGTNNRVFTNTYADCLDQTTGPVEGACCYTFFGRDICAEGVTVDVCDSVQGTFHPGMVCNDVCPTPQLALAVTGPSSTPGGVEYSLQFEVSNPGVVRVENVQLSTPDADTCFVCIGEQWGRSDSWSVWRGRQR